MNDFPNFMKNPANRVAPTHHGVEGYVFDGRDGSQMAVWTCSQTASSSAHSHEFDEYMLVVQGCYWLFIDGNRIPVNAGMDYFIPVARFTPGKSKRARERFTSLVVTGLIG
jgi:quercetin dioxygenase-like cupin family protein